MVRHGLGPKQTAQQRKRMVCQCLIDERVLALKRLGGLQLGCRSSSSAGSMISGNSSETARSRCALCRLFRLKRLS